MAGSYAGGIGVTITYPWANAQADGLKFVLEIERGGFFWYVGGILMIREPDIFYDTSGLTHGQQETLLRKSYSICSEWWLDKLDCSVSWARQRVPGATFEDAMSHFSDGAFFVVIHRRQILMIDKPYLEVGFRSMEHVDYFLWIIVPLERSDAIVKGLPVLS